MRKNIFFSGRDKIADEIMQLGAAHLITGCKSPEVLRVESICLRQIKPCELRDVHHCL